MESGPAVAPADPRLRAVRERLRQRMVDEALPSVAAAVACGDETVWEEAIGWADRERRIPATPHTLYSLASISKPITATGLMLLCERGRVDLDRPVNDYLAAPGVTARVGSVDHATVRRLADHSSGLPLHYHFFPEDEAHPRPPMEETIRRYGQLVSAPGEKYRYSNLGYGILDHLIQRVTGVSYPAFLRRELFLPLGMTRSSAELRPDLEPYRARRYDGGGVPLPEYGFDHPGASAVYCSVHDLIRFARLHLETRLPDQKAILSSESLAAMREPSAAGGEEGVASGVGWRIDRRLEGLTTVSHTGGMDGVSTILVLVPARRLAVAVLANARSQAPAAVAEEVLEVFCPGCAAVQERARSIREEREAAARLRPFRTPPELAGRWSGEVQTCRGTAALVLDFRPSDEVHARLEEQLWTLVNDARWEGGELTGKMLGELATQDTSRRPYRLHLELRLRGERLCGAVNAVSPPGCRLGNALAHWADLRRA